ncbi:MAG: hypothetical protein AB7S97_06900 [Thermoplasmata archaeon]
MFSKKVFKGFLVEPEGRLLKEFVFSTKGEVSYDEVKQATAGKGDLAALGAFEVGKMVGTIVRGKRMHMILVGRDVVEDEDVEFVKEMISSVEASFEASLDSKLADEKKAAEEAAEALRRMKEGEAARAQEITELDQLREELDKLRQDTEAWQKELEEFEAEVTDRHTQINERVTLLLEREQSLNRSKQAFEAASDAKRDLVRGLQEGFAQSVAEYEKGYSKLARDRQELTESQERHRAELEAYQAQKAAWEKEVENL